ncbi:MAG: neutral/alkaline non-lysosomal ceramidase N-terminal domain-containing protein [Myxococcales bacterium]|nr:neutral/alkaline non-lysosomal ceramidase N-terminal domain-containing protein [Myxococcales bacterium]
MRRLLRLALFCALLPTTACLVPDEASDPKPGSGRQPDVGPEPDAAPMDDAAPPADAAPMDDAAPPADAGADAAPADAGIPPGGEACTYAFECAYGDCLEGACVNERPDRCPDGDDAECPEGEICGGFSGRFYCFRPCEKEGTCPIRPRPCRSNADCPDGTSCHDALCRNDCVTDLDCPADGYCVDGGCLRYPEDLFQGDAPTPVGQPGQLHAGVSVVPLDYPMGVSMAGFGGRPGPRTPYAKALGGSDRVFEDMDVRVIAVSTDDEFLILMRLPLCWSTDYMLALTAQKLQALTVDDAHPNGINFDGKIITSATHSHSQPGRYWNLVPATGFGVFGYGAFSPEMVDRYTTSFAHAIKAALDDMRPAKMGWAMLDDFDPNSRIHSDRRGASPQFRDDRMLVLRVDDAETDTPMGAIVNFAIHGTHMEETWLTGDAPGGIERIATERLSAKVGAPVPVLFFQGNAGDISPRGDDGTRVNWAKMQAVGHRAWAPFERAWEAATPRSDVRLEVVTRRIPVSYELMGYDREVPEFQAPNGRPQVYGAFQCVTDERRPEDEPYMDGMLGCRLNIQSYLGAPVVQLQKTTLSAFRLDVCPTRGADCDTGPLVVNTLPGESTSILGVALSDEIEADARAAGLDDLRVMNFGYSQDHHLYLLTPEDWFHGGYEAAQGLWGWKLGRYLMDNSRALAGQLFTDEKEDNTTGIKPTWWPALEDDTVEPTETVGEPGAAVIQPPAAAPRGALIETRWTGGHPGVDVPTVRLEVQIVNGWATALRPGDWPYDHGGFESLTLYHGDYAADHTWGARWELPFQLPAGTYRLAADGHAWKGGAKMAYAFRSTSFEVTPATLVVREATVENGRVAFKVNYPDGPSNDDGATPFDELEFTGHLLRWDGEFSFPDPLRNYSFVLGGPLPDAPVQVSVGDAASEAVETARDQVAVDLVTARPAAGDPVVTRLEGWVTTRVELDAPAEPGTHTLTVSDRYGNAASFDVEVPAP